MVSRKRHLAKAISYRLGGSILAFITGYVFAGSVKIGGAIGLVDFVTKIILYYIHERIWYKFISLGIKKD